MISCRIVVVNGAIDVFELECINQWLQTIGHLLRRVGVDDEYGAHCVVVAAMPVAMFAHRVVLETGASSSCPTVDIVDGSDQRVLGCM